jgi:dihydropyrimidinase
MRTLITNGTVVNADGMFRADVLVEGETIVAVGLAGGPSPSGAALAAVAGGAIDRTIDAAGRWVVPGGIDVHTHMELPFGGTFSKDTFETGSRAAAFGGTTRRAAGRCARAWTHGWPRQRATAPSTTAST